TGSGSAAGGCQGGDPIHVLYHAERPDFNEPVAGYKGVAVFIIVAMVAMAALALWSVLPLFRCWPAAATCLSSWERSMRPINRPEYWTQVRARSMRKAVA